MKQFFFVDTFILLKACGNPYFCCTIRTKTKLINGGRPSDRGNDSGARGGVGTQGWKENLKNSTLFPRPLE